MGKNRAKDQAREENAFFDVASIKERISIRYPFGYIPRADIGEATGNLLHPKTMANRDSARGGQQIRGAVKIGGKVCYPVDEVIAYIEAKTSPFIENVCDKRNVIQ